MATLNVPFSDSAKQQSQSIQDCGVECSGSRMEVHIMLRDSRGLEFAEDESYQDGNSQILKAEVTNNRRCLDVRGTKNSFKKYNGFTNQTFQRT
ncbi:hypothetical protein J6590_081681 [Homalodisca vitripennis]|nr:hypothetical protein J6590_081681 [Homalodisca vitripennis]